MRTTGLLTRAVRTTTTLAVASLASCSGCDRRNGTAANDTATAAAAPQVGSTATSPVSSGWTNQDGPVLLVNDGTANEATVIVPTLADSVLRDSAQFDVTAMQAGTFTLLRRGGVAGEARVSSASTSDADNCPAWPIAQLAPARGDGMPTWTVAFASGHAQSIPIDSVEALPKADSLRLAAEMARTASALPDDSVAAFRGLPFVVRDLHRFYLKDGGKPIEVVIAFVARRLATEANPREEHLTLIAERDSGSTDRYAPAFSARRSGPEESVEVEEVLAVVQLGTRTDVVLSREIGNAIGYALLERTAPHQWVLRWKSALTGC